MKTKLPVHCEPLVYICTPGVMVAVAAGVAEKDVIARVAKERVVVGPTPDRVGPRATRQKVRLQGRIDAFARFVIGGQHTLQTPTMPAAALPMALSHMIEAVRVVS